MFATFRKMWCRHRWGQSITHGASHYSAVFKQGFLSATLREEHFKHLVVFALSFFFLMVFYIKIIHIYLSMLINKKVLCGGKVKRWFTQMNLHALTLQYCHTLTDCILDIWAPKSSFSGCFWTTTIITDFTQNCSVAFHQLQQQKRKWHKDGPLPAIYFCIII